MKDKSYKIAGIILAVVAVLIVAAIVIGTLATPLVLAIIYSWYWMFLYPIYFVLVFLAFAYMRAYSEYKLLHTEAQNNEY